MKLDLNLTLHIETENKDEAEPIIVALNGIQALAAMLADAEEAVAPTGDEQPNTAA